MHYQLATVLEFTPNGRESALKHVQKAVEGFKARLAELTGTQPAGDEVRLLSDVEKDGERKDVEGLIGDLEVKIEELKAAPEAGDPVSESIKHLLGGSAEAAFGALADANGIAGGSGAAEGVASAPVNDLTSMVKKKKKVPVKVDSNGSEDKGKEVENGEKRKLDTADEPDAKRAKPE